MYHVPRYNGQSLYQYNEDDFKFWFLTSIEVNNEKLLIYSFFFFLGLCVSILVEIESRLHCMHIYLRQWQYLTNCFIFNILSVSVISISSLMMDFLKGGFPEKWKVYATAIAIYDLYPKKINLISNTSFRYYNLKVIDYFLRICILLIFHNISFLNNALKTTFSTRCLCPV